MRLTISMPCFGRPQRTIRAIESICNQTINGWEALVVGDGCSVMQDYIFSNYFSDFCHLLGMLSSSFLHVELAIPTSLLLQKDLSFSNNENLGKYGETENPALFWDNKAGTYFFPEKLL